tara:strand:- start:10608 stop:11384 length:777 start_codon:yes stop_codon:yes gene_type:complete
MISEAYLISFTSKLIREIKKKIPLVSKKIKFISKKSSIVDPVTEIDVEMEKIIRNTIKKNFKNHNIIGEELEDENINSNYTWIIDPIDGTKSLILNLPTWSNLVGLYYKKKCIFSFANFPMLGKTFIGTSKSSFLLIGKKKNKIKTNKIARVDNMKLAINTLHPLKYKKVDKFIKNYKGFFRTTASDSYNFCSVAEGKLDVLIESGLKIVDILPIVKIVESSGAIITNWSGEKKFECGKVVVASNKKIHQFILKKIKY